MKLVAVCVGDTPDQPIEGLLLERVVSSKNYVTSPSPSQRGYFEERTELHTASRDVAEGTQAKFKKRKSGPDLEYMNNVDTKEKCQRKTGDTLDYIFSNVSVRLFHFVC